jgi:hypothetical protein
VPGPQGRATTGSRRREPKRQNQSTFISVLILNEYCKSDVKNKNSTKYQTGTLTQAGHCIKSGEHPGTKFFFADA